MIEKLVPVDLPPGLVNNGTTYQSKGRWFSGNLVRFFQGTIQPVGGWTKRTLTGATIVGVPNAAVSWQTNDGLSWMAIGTDTSLYVVDSNNVVSDVLTVGLTGGTPYRWQLAVFGSWVIAVYNLQTFDAGFSINGLVWQGDPAVRATQISAGNITNVPNTMFGCVSTPERFLVLLRGSDPDGAAHRAPTGGAILDPTTGLVVQQSLGGAPAPTGSATFDPEGGGLVL